MRECMQIKKKGAVNLRKAIQRTCLCLSAFCTLLWGVMFGISAQLPGQFSVFGNQPVTLGGYLSVVDVEARTAVQNPSVRTAASTGSSHYQASAKLFGIFPLKEVAVQVTDPASVVIGGVPFGIKIYTDGVLVVGMTDVDTATGPYNPAKSAGIKVGDVIVSINDTPVTTNEQVAQMVEESGGKTMTFRIRRDNIEFDVRFYPARHQTENCWKAGLWVRDSSAGIGMLTFYDEESGMFAGLGHAVCDVDTGDVLPLAGGEIVPVEIYSVVKGESGDPGELRGGFDEGTLGNLLSNGETGVYGYMQPGSLEGQTYPVALKQQIKTGDAQVYTTIDGEGPEWYDIKIEQVRYNDASPSRNMVIEITDERLLEKTGGIVQGMSGSPIVQDGKLVGAVTHVYVNDPQKGFAIFAENMLKTAETVSTAKNSSEA